MIEKHRIGKIGEEIATKYLVNRGFRVICRNYRKKYGEIDIICEKEHKLFFVEVKSSRINEVTRGTDRMMPEEHVDRKKLQKIERTAMAYLEENRTDAEWEFVVVAVDIDQIKKIANVRIFQV